MSHILIIDDDPQLGRSLARLLEQAGYTCSFATDPTDAADGGVRPDAILIELQPEDAPALPRLRAALGEVPFVFMAGGHADFAPLGELMGAADDWVVKPAAPQELVVRVRTALRRAQGDRTN